MRVKILIALAIASIVLLCSGTAFAAIAPVAPTLEEVAGLSNPVVDTTSITGPGSTDSSLVAETDNVKNVASSSSLGTGFPVLGKTSDVNSMILTQLAADDFACPSLTGFLPAGIAVDASSDFYAAKPRGVDCGTYPFLFTPAIVSSTGISDLAVNGLTCGYNDYLPYGCGYGLAC